MSLKSKSPKLIGWGGDFYADGLMMNYLFGQSRICYYFITCTCNQKIIYENLAIFEKNQAFQNAKFDGSERVP